MELFDWIKGHYEVVIGLSFGTSGVVAWLFRWLDTVRENKRTVGEQAMEYITLLGGRVTSLEVSDREKAERIDQMERELNTMKVWVDILIGQLEEAGIKPAPKPELRGTDKEEKKEITRKIRRRGFRP